MMEQVLPNREQSGEYPTMEIACAQQCVSDMGLSGSDVSTSGCVYRAVSSARGTHFDTVLGGLQPAGQVLVARCTAVLAQTE